MQSVTSDGVSNALEHYMSFGKEIANIDLDTLKIAGFYKGLWNNGCTNKPTNYDSLMEFSVILATISYSVKLVESYIIHFISCHHRNLSFVTYSYSMTTCTYWYISCICRYRININSRLKRKY